MNRFIFTFLLILYSGISQNALAEKPLPPLRLTALDLEITGPGKNDSALLNWIQNYPLRPGLKFDLKEYEKTKDALFDIASEEGYLHATLEKKELRINLKNQTAAIILHLNTGPRYYFGSVTFNKTALSPDFLKRFVTIKEGEPFSSERLLTFQENLNNSRYFREVNVTPELEKAQDFKIPTLVDVVLPPAKQYTIGAGYGTFTGPRLTLGTDLRRTTETGQHLTAQLKLSQVLSGLAAKYFIPGQNPITEQYTIGANIQKFKPKNGDSFSSALSLSYIKTFDEWQRTVSLNYLSERYIAFNQPEKSSQSLYPQLSLSRIKADNLVYPMQGSALSFSAEAASKNLLSTMNFAQTEIKGKIIFNPFLQSRVILRGDLGYTVAENLQKMPLTLRFFAGGLNSVRGYAYSSIGPGRYLKTASVEYQHHLTGKWNAALFYDVGTAANQINAALSRGAGVGLIYASSIGPIELYVARAETTPGKPFRIEFNIGPDF